MISSNHFLCLFPSKVDGISLRTSRHFNHIEFDVVLFPGGVVFMSFDYEAAFLVFKSLVNRYGMV